MSQKSRSPESLFDVWLLLLSEIQFGRHSFPLCTSRHVWKQFNHDGWRYMEGELTYRVSFFNWDPQCQNLLAGRHSELLGGSQLKKDTLYDFISRNLFLKYLHLVEANRFHRQTPDLCLHRHSRNSGDCAEYDARLWLHGFHNFSDVLRIHFIQGQERYVPGFAHLEEWNLISAYCRGEISSCLRTLLFDGDKRKNAEWQRPWNSYMSYLNTSHTCHTYSWGREGC